MRNPINLFKPKIKMIVAIIFAFVCMQLIVRNEVFLGEIPRLNPEFMAKIQDAPTYVVQTPSKILSFLSNPFGKSVGDKALEQIAASAPPGLLYESIAIGVDAAEDRSTGKTYVTLKKGTQVEIITKVEPDGKVKKYLKIIKEPTTP